jgi:hypothetical protein
MKWSSTAAGYDLSSPLVWTGPCLFASLKDKTLVDATAACGFLPRSPPPDGYSRESKVTDLGRTTVLKWELGLCLGLAASTTDAELGGEGEEMTAERFQRLDEMVAELFREGSPISTDVEPVLADSVDQTSSDEPAFEAGLVETTGDGGSAAAMAEQPESALAGLDLDTAIRLRWALRDIKAKRTKFSPVSPDDLTTLIELGLVEIRDEVAALTHEGDRALGGT